MSDLEPPDQPQPTTGFDKTPDESAVAVPKLSKKSLITLSGVGLAIGIAVVVFIVVNKEEDPLKSKVYKELDAQNNEIKAQITDLKVQVETSTSKRDEMKAALEEMQQRVQRNQEDYNVFIRGLGS